MIPNCPKQKLQLQLDHDKKIKEQISHLLSLVASSITKDKSSYLFKTNAKIKQASKFCSRDLK
jgi:hypothetical protein